MNKVEAYKWAAKRIRAQVLRNIDRTATLGNTSAILKEYFPGFFWVGFYFVNTDHLLLGPFQGPPACIKLNLRQGVCANCVEKKETVIVPNVHEFPGHVPCSDRSNSEIVVPVFDKNKNIRAILDIDSEKFNDFDETDAKGLEAVAALLSEIM
ncbi:GAF domain-containing protein [candidate division KSB1 bacterium]|nr:GAF domain-containing protein [candidate division KSB1 bacterium]